MTPAPSIELVIDPSQTGDAIDEHFLGLSYETEQVLPNSKGGHYFSPRNTALIALFRTIGVRNLRVGGNSVDRPVTAIPGAADIDLLFAFARLAGVKVIYSVRLQDGDAQSAAQLAAYIHSRYPDILECFAIGNEPAYYKPYASYRQRWRPIMQAITAAVPEARFCGPDTNPEPAWCRQMVEEFGMPGPLSMLSVHNYPGDCSYKNPGAASVQDLIPKDAAVARQQMLSPAWYEIYAKVHKGMADAVAGTSIPFRLAETNNFWYGGLAGASDCFAAALWSADYLYWWASHGARGLNFHTGDRVGGGTTSLTSRYTAFATSDQGYDVRPLSYGMKLFDLGRHGRLMPVSVSAGDLQDLSAYATIAPDKRLAVTVINKSHGPHASDVPIELKLPPTCTLSDAQIISLSAGDEGVAATSGITLGGEPIGADGSWHGRSTPLQIAADGNAVHLKAPAASAAVVTAQVRCSR